MNCRRVSFLGQFRREKSFRRWRNSVVVFQKDTLLDGVRSLDLDDLLILVFELLECVVRVELQLKILFFVDTRSLFHNISEGIRQSSRSQQEVGIDCGSGLTGDVSEIECVALVRVTQEWMEEGRRKMLMMLMFTLSLFLCCWDDVFLR
jgi:hypothetical protein